MSIRKEFKLGIAARSDPYAPQLTAEAGASTSGTRLETRRV
jgi:hypothetical protein